MDEVFAPIFPLSVSTYAHSHLNFPEASTFIRSGINDEISLDTSEKTRKKHFHSYGRQSSFKCTQISNESPKCPDIAI